MTKMNKAQQIDATKNGNRGRRITNRQAAAIEGRRDMYHVEIPFFGVMELRVPKGFDILHRNRFIRH